MNLLGNIFHTTIQASELFSYQVLLMPCPFTGPKMGWFKFFVSDQKFIFILWQSQTFCSRQKDNLHSVKLVFVPASKVFEEALNAVKF